MVTIKMEMPKSCSECPLMYDYLNCSVTSTPIDMDSYDEKRLADCPLQEIDTKDE